MKDLRFQLLFETGSPELGYPLHALSPRGLATSSSVYGSLEDPVNPLLYVLAYGARFVAQGTPADMNGLADLIEAGIRFPGFSFINIQSPCVTYGQFEQQLKAQILHDKTRPPTRVFSL